MKKITTIRKNRRDFLQFLGYATVVAAATPLLTGLSGCQSSGETTSKTEATPAPVVDNSPLYPIQGIKPSLEDKLELAANLSYTVLARWGEKISEKDTFGSHCDYLAYVPLTESNIDEGLLWVNHEYLSSLFVSGFAEGDYAKKTKADVDKEMYNVGGSIIHIAKNADGSWHLQENSPYNRRITAHTPIPFAWHEPIAGATQGIGTLGNCAGGVTPWGNILTCEENYDMFYGETDYSDPKKPKHVDSYSYGWDKQYPKNLPEHYGWVVEVDVRTGAAKKLVALGRCAHECATCHALPDGRVVVYTGDDHNSEHLYKFISDAPNSLEKGKLYVANTEKGEWISLVYEEQPLLKEKFKSQTEVLIRLREAAKIVGATPLDRPEDIEIDPNTGAILISLTNNKPKGNYLGTILKIEETGNDKAAMTFKASTFLTGGKELGFACPDNMAFDKKGNLWFTSDISGESIGKGAYEGLGNNGLFMIPNIGAQKGKVVRVANAPKDAELTGPFFSPDGKTLFLSVQHPGELSPDTTNFTSIFPDGAGKTPKSSVVAISGKAFDDLMAG
jgi:secreted PhoX family phosphatase